MSHTISSRLKLLTSFTVSLYLCVFSSSTHALVVAPSALSPSSTSQGQKIASKEVALNRLFLEKRFSNVRFTYYQPGLGACGEQNTESDFVVALTSQLWESGAHCGKAVTITVDGKIANARVVDECPGCGTNGLDFSPGLFGFFASLSEGVLFGDWEFDSGDKGKGSNGSSDDRDDRGHSDSPATNERHGLHQGVAVVATHSRAAQSTTRTLSPYAMTSGLSSSRALRTKTKTRNTFSTPASSPTSFFLALDPTALPAIDNTLPRPSLPYPVPLENVSPNLYTNEVEGIEVFRMLDVAILRLAGLVCEGIAK